MNREGLRRDRADQRECSEAAARASNQYSAPDTNPDWDGDGLSNLAKTSGTNPNDAIQFRFDCDDVEIGSEFAPFDTDGDGFIDALVGWRRRRDTRSFGSGSGGLYPRHRWR